jgi:hypothetical protein
MCLQLSRHGAAGGWLRAVHGALARQAQTTSITIDPSTTVGDAQPAFEIYRNRSGRSRLR